MKQILNLLGIKETDKAIPIGLITGICEIQQNHHRMSGKAILSSGVIPWERT
jgi:hypothetical protein